MASNWHRTEIDNHIDLLTGFPFSSEQYSEDTQDIRLLRGDNVVQGTIRWDGVKRWPISQSEDLERYQLAEDDIVIAMDRTWVKAGLKIAQIKKDDTPSLLVQRVARIRAKGNLDQNYLAQCFSSYRFEQYVKGNQTETAVPHISPQQIRDFTIHAPKIEDQERISVILQAWDEAINKSLSLLEAKRNQIRGIRRALIETAYTPNSAAKLSQICSRVRRKNDGQEYPVMTISAKSGFLLQSDKYARDMAGSSVENYTVILRGEFAYNKGNSLTSPQGCIFRFTEEKALVPHVYFCFGLNCKQNPDFYVHVFESGFLNHQLSRVINSGVRNDGLLNLNAEDFFNCRVPNPSESEQRRIARTLDDLNSELALHEQRVSLLQKQKRGLMQKLLTGEWRVKL
jgi:type I restriction enzyme, S subunit